jgi:hypothetical protein
MSRIRRTRLAALVAGMVIPASMIGAAIAGSTPATASTISRPAAVRIHLGASSRRELTKLYAEYRRIPIADIGGNVASAARAARLNGGREWAVMRFVASRRVPLSISVGFQDGGGTAIFTRSPGKQWKVAGNWGGPLACDRGVPATIRGAWGFTDCPSAKQASARSQRNRRADTQPTTMSGLATIANNEVGVADDPTETTFSNSYDCNPFTGLENTSASDVMGNGTACGVDSTDFSAPVQDRTEFWCADFTKWVWAQAGVTSNLSMLNAGANSFALWGYKSGQTLTLNGTSPQVGDAIVLFPPGTFTSSSELDSEASEYVNDQQAFPSADHVGIVVAVESNGDIETVNGDFQWGGDSDIRVITTAPTYYTPQDFANVAENEGNGSNEQWVFVSPGLASASTPAPSLVANVSSSGAFDVKENGLSNGWTQEEASGVASAAVASDSKNGPLLGYLSTSGAFYVKEGSLSGGWTQEQSSGVAAIALASDSSNGALLGYLSTSGAFYVKEGSLSSGWTQEQSSGAAAIALASDPSNGPLLGYLSTSGAFYAKEGSLSNGWTQEQSSGVASIALASDTSNGPLLGYTSTSGAFYAKETTLSNGWIQEQSSGVASIALASDGANGPLLGYDSTSGVFGAKAGGLSGGWTQEEPSGTASIAMAPGSGD